MNRRGLLRGLFGVAPAIIAAPSLMRISTAFMLPSAAIINPYQDGKWVIREELLNGFRDWYADKYEASFLEFISGESVMEKGRHVQ